MAAEYVATNKNPRPVAQWHVDEFCVLLRNNEFHLTHQGIAIDENGNLRDGQHRLLAIIKTGISAWMAVTTGISEEAVFSVDRGMRRSNNCVLEMDKRSAEIITLIAKIHSGASRPINSQLFLIKDRVGIHAENLIKACGTAKRAFDPSASQDWRGSEYVA